MDIKFLVASRINYKIIDCAGMSVKEIDKVYRTYNKSKYFEIERIEYE